MNDFIKAFGELTMKDVPLAGGKGANLGELMRAGFPVPPGFCITAEAYRYFTAKTGLTQLYQSILDSGSDDTQNVTLQSSIITEKILAEKIPQEITNAVCSAYGNLIGRGTLVAVRSSATAEDLPEASFAGQQDSFLNIDEANLLEHVKKCWASLWTERAMHYRLNKGFEHSKVYLAVVIQRMVEPEVSGVAFSINPITQSHKEVVIESVWGLGEGIVSGQVTPDRYIINKHNHKLLHREISEKANMVIQPENGLGTFISTTPQNIKNKPSLSERQVLELAKIIFDIEKHYEVPQDIEWTLSDKFYILQSRPVTTLQFPAATSRVTEPELFSYDPNLEWTNVGIKERYHKPLSVLGWSIIEPCQNEGLRWPCKLVSGKSLPQDYKFFSCIYGHLYMNFSLFKGIFPSSVLEPYLIEDVGGEFQPRRGKFKELILTIKTIRAIQKMARILDQAFNNMLPGYLHELKKYREYDLEKLDNSEVLEYIRTNQELGKSFFRHQVSSVFVAAYYYKLLTGLMLKWLDDKDMSISSKLVSGLTGNLTVKSNNDIWKLARLLNRSPQLKSWFQAMSTEEFINQAETTKEGRFFLENLEKLLEQHGHLNINMDIASDFWWESPDIVLSMLRGSLSAGIDQDPEMREKEKYKVREETEALVRSRISLIKRLIFNRLLPRTQTYMLLRDNRHYYVTMPFSLIKKAINLLGHRLKVNDLIQSDKDIFFLTLEEVEGLIKRELSAADARSLIENRKSARLINVDELSSFIKGMPSTKKHKPANETTGKTIKGIAGSPGIASGPVKVILSPSDFSRFKKGDILVAVSTDPAWTPLFAIAGGVVTEYGGLLSHGAIVAREYGIPAVLDIENATKILKDGAIIEVDGNRGSVNINV